MNREERRRQQRQQGRGSDQPYRGGRWDARPGRLTELRAVEPQRSDAEVQDFLAGSVFAQGAAVLGADTGDPDAPPPLFVVLVHEDERTFGPAPVLRELFARLDSGQLAQQVERGEIIAGTSWAVLAREENCLVKLKVDLHEPIGGSARLVLLGENYPALWQYVAGGGVVAVSSMERLHRVQQRPGVTLADAVGQCVPFGVASSPGILHLIAAYDWPAGHLTG